MACIDRERKELSFCLEWSRPSYKRAFNTIFCKKYWKELKLFLKEDYELNNFEKTIEEDWDDTYIVFTIKVD